MTPTDKLTVRLAALATLAHDTAAVAEQQTLSILADAERALKRAQKRAEGLSGKWERTEIRPANGPAVEFTGRLLCETSFQDRKEGNPVTLELYETRGGAMIAVVAFERNGHESETAKVIDASDDTQAMRFAVMDAFLWRTEAKKMVRALGWSLTVEVE